ncbi:hypothetical protein [Sorangium sp. So ce590]|uniref:hypothetical protein n=1 Tax=unclassified Sorangium TaxID=2621164 RepID=UPI003F5F73D5
MASPPAPIAQVAATTAHAATGSPQLVGSDNNLVGSDNNHAIHGFMECGERYPLYSIPVSNPPDSRLAKHWGEIA